MTATESVIQGQPCCAICRYSTSVVTGVVEASFAPDGFIDITDLRCRRFPPIQTFWSTRFPTVKPMDLCGEFFPKFAPLASSNPSLPNTS